MCPVSKKSLEDVGKRVDVRVYGVVQTRILNYLRDHKEQGFSQGELRDCLGLSDQAVYRRLKILVKRNIVVKEEHPVTKTYMNEDGSEYKRTWIGIFYRYIGSDE